MNSQTKTYSYDAIGNTTADGMQGTTVIDWNVYGKVRSLTNSASQGVTYTYGADGQRAGKVIGSIKEWYVRDASGNIMVTYTKDAGINAGNLSTKEFYKYGSSLLAIKHKVVDMETVPNADDEQTIIRGEDDYILTDHLGNTRAIVSDKKLQEEDPMNAGEVLYYEADVKAAYYYSAYGAISKTYGSDPVVAFNGQHKSGEISEDAQTALYWEYNGDVGRRWNVDPVIKPWSSPYSCLSNMPIVRVDPIGDDDYFDAKGNFLGSDNKGTAIRIISNPLGEIKNIFLKDGATINKNIALRNSQLLSNMVQGTDPRDLPRKITLINGIINHYGKEAGVKGKILPGINFNKDAVAYTISESEVKYNVLSNSNGSFLDNYNNIVNVLYHEKLHQDDKRKNKILSTFAAHAEIYIQQFNHKSFKNMDERSQVGFITSAMDFILNEQFSLTNYASNNSDITESLVLNLNAAIKSEGYTVVWGGGIATLDLYKNKKPISRVRMTKKKNPN